MKTCAHAQPHLAGRASLTKRQTIRLWTVAPSCWILRFWKKRASRPAGPWPAWKRLQRNSRSKPCKGTNRRSAVRLYLHGRSVGKHLGDSLHHFGGVIAETHHGICAVLRGVPQQQFIRFDACLFAQLGEDGDVAADKRLQGRAQIPDHTARTHDDP